MTMFGPNQAANLIEASLPVTASEADSIMRFRSEQLFIQNILPGDPRIASTGNAIGFTGTQGVGDRSANPRLPDPPRIVVPPIPDGPDWPGWGDPPILPPPIIPPPDGSDPPSDPPGGTPLFPPLPPPGGVIRQPDPLPGSSSSSSSSSATSASSSSSSSRSSSSSSSAASSSASGSIIDPLPDEIF